MRPSSSNGLFHGNRRPRSADHRAGWSAELRQLSPAHLARRVRSAQRLVGLGHAILCAPDSLRAGSAVSPGCVGFRRITPTLPCRHEDASSVADSAHNKFRADAYARICASTNAILFGGPVYRCRSATITKLMREICACTCLCHANRISHALIDRHDWQHARLWRNRRAEGSGCGHVWCGHHAHRSHKEVSS